MSSDGTARARFYKESRENKARSAEEGRYACDEVEMVEIVHPGDNKTAFVDYVKPEYIERFRDQYEAFKRGEVRAASGTPLEHWPILNTARVAELKAIGILSVDELAAVSDHTLTKMGMGARDLREQARAFISAAKGGAGVAHLVSENAQMKEQLALMQSQIAAMMAANAKPEESAGKAIEDCTDQELKAFIKKATGEPVRGNPSRETLVERATELSSEPA